MQRSDCGENERLTHDGMPKWLLEIVPWAMEEAESNDPKQARKWRAFRSHRRAPTGLEEMKVGVVMALPSLGTMAMPILIEDDGPPPSKKKANEVIYTPRQSPCFLQCSPCLLSLARSRAVG